MFHSLAKIATAALPLRAGLSSKAAASATVGSVVPEIVFKARVRDPASKESNPFVWKDVTTTHLFKDKRVVLFALPGGKDVFCVKYTYI
jgi:hypothetical protein